MPPAPPSGPYTTLHYTDTHTEAVRSDGDRQGFVAKQSNVKDDII